MDRTFFERLEEQWQEVRRARVTVATLVALALSGGWFGARAFYGERIETLKQQLQGCQPGGALAADRMPATGPPARSQGRRLTDEEKDSIASAMPPLTDAAMIFFQHCGSMECYHFADDISQPVNASGWTAYSGKLLPQLPRPAHGISVVASEERRGLAEAVAKALSQAALTTTTYERTDKLVNNGEAIVIMVGPK